MTVVQNYPDFWQSVAANDKMILKSFRLRDMLSDLKNCRWGNIDLR